MTNAWIVTTTNQISALVEAARGVGGTVTVVAVGAEATGFAGVDRVLSVATDANVAAEAYAPAVVAALADAKGDVVFAGNRPADRALAGAVAAAHGVPMIVGASSITATTAEVSRFGGITLETVSFPAGAVFVLEGGAAAEGDAVAAEEIAGEHYGAVVASVEAAGSGPANLAAARRIVSAGRGFKAQEDLALAEALASALGAEIACSRPLAEGTAWLPEDRYVGVSGMRVAPDVYVAVGISGQVQHTSGMNDTKVVVAVNNDDKAPIFQVADYGIVGDLYEVLPALTAALA